MIKKIHIRNFGKLNNLDINFEKGLNVIFGENEAGKSTILAFIFMIFYGENSRSKDVSSNLRLKYRPWESLEMSGYLDFEKYGILYRIDRKFLGSNLKDEINIIEIETGKSLVLPPNESPGQFFLGINSETFKKTLMLTSENSVISNNDKNDEISKKMINLLSTGQEDLSFRNIISNIDKKIELYKSKSGKLGILVDINNKIFQINYDIEIAKNDEIQKIKLRKDIEKIKKENHILLEKERLLKEGFEIQKERKKIIDEKKNLLLNSKDREIYENQKIKNDLEKKINLEKNRSIFVSFGFLNYLLVGVVFLLFALTLFKVLDLKIFLGIIFIILGLYFINYFTKNKEKTSKIDTLENSLLSINENISKNKKIEDNLRSEIYYIDQAIKELDFSLNSLGIKENQDIYKDIIELKDEIHKNDLEIESIFAISKERFSAKENLSTLEKELEILNEEYQENLSYFNTLQNTKELLEKSYKEFEIGFSRLLNDRVSSKMAEITNGKYDSIKVSNDFDISVENKNTGEVVNWRYLSSGTIDQIYLALRFSVADLIIENPKNKIFLLDDIFIRYDKIREKNLKNMIFKDSGLQQIIYFTCHKEELREIEENYSSNIIYLN